MTGIFKTKKGDLRKQGFDVEQISEHGEGERVFSGTTRGSHIRS